MLKSVEINKLFNNEDIIIDFSKRSIIITGDNGNGKTTILNIIYNVLVGKYSSIINTKFHKVEIIFGANFDFMDKITVDRTINDNGEIIKIIYQHENQELEFMLKLLNIQKTIIIDKITKKELSGKNILFSDKKHDNQLFNPEEEISLISILEMIKEEDFLDKLKKINQSLLYFPTYRRIDLDVESYYASLFDTPMMNYLRREQMEKHRRFGVIERRVIGMSNSDIEDILREYSRTLNEVSSNNLDILLRDFTKNTMLEMNNNSREIKIENLTIDLKILEQLKDINTSLKLNIPNETLENISNQYEQNIDFLKEMKSRKPKRNEVDKVFEVMLSIPMMQVLQKLQESYNAYNTKMKEALRNYDYISSNLSDFSGNKLKLIKTELNEFKFNKIGTEIEKISDFSTGEKQLITFLVYSAIKLPSEIPSLVIIDEPELSLHVKWQNKLLKNILKKKNIQVLSATHSPYIINKSEVDSLVIRKVERY